MHFKKIGEYLLEEQVCDQESIDASLQKQAELMSEGVFKPLGEILRDDIGIAHGDMEKCLRRMYFDVLSNTPLFRDFSQKSLESTVSIADHQVFPGDFIIFNQGDPADSFCVVVAGSVKVYLASSEGAENTLAELGPGEGFGEMALLTGEPRSASIKTLQPTSLLTLSKKYFDQLCQMKPEVSAGLFKVLSQRVIQGNKEIINATETEKAYQHLVALQNEVPYHPLVGKSRFIKNLQDQISRAASNSQPVYINGEEGTMHISVARAIHNRSGRANDPLLYMNSQTITLDGTHSQENDPRDPMALELAQASALFGHDQGVMPLAKTRRLGLLQVCREGTVVIEHIEQLAASVQEQLLDFMNSNTFRPMGSRDPVHSSARVMVTSSADLDRLVREGSFSGKLYEYFSGQSIALLPIKRRKGDLRYIAEKMIERFNKSSGKKIKGMSPEAYQRIMDYSWPGNMTEIEVVFRRAVGLSQGEYLLPEDIFLGISPPQGKYTYNLFRQDRIRDFFSSSLYPWGLQVAAAIVFGIIFLLAFRGSQNADRNISLILVWALWWPLFTISWFVGARIWCSVCPMGAANDLMNRFCSLKLKVPSFIRNHGLLLSALGFGLIVYVEVATNMTYSPMATGILLTVITCLAILSGVLFERRLWCRYLCPLGRMAAVFSGTSLVEWRANINICNSTCQSNNCYTGKDRISGCPLYQGPFSLHSNQDCILCGKCVKACENNSPALNLRIPGHELWAAAKPEQATATLLPVIVGAQFFRGLEHNQVFIPPLEQLYGHWGGLAVLFLSAMLFSFVCIGVSGHLAFGHLKNTGIRKSHLFSYAIVPLAFIFELGYQLQPLFSRLGQFFPTLGRQLGIPLEFLDFSTPAAAAKPWQVLLVLSGIIVSLLVQRTIAKLQQTADQENLSLVKSIPVLILACFYIGLFITM